MTKKILLQKIWHNLAFKSAVAAVWLWVIWFLMESRLPYIALPGNSDHYIDKLIHILIFGIMTLLTWRIFKVFWHRRWARIVWPCVLVAAYAYGTEYYQQFVPGRGMSTVDLIASFAGIILAVALIYWQRERKPSLLVHLCCGPCAAGVMRSLKRDYFPALLFANSNLDTPEEYSLRYKAAKKLANFYGLILVKSTYAHDDWLKLVAGHETAPERGSRCLLCYRYRMSETAIAAKRYGYDYFATSLTTSPYKNRTAIMDIGHQLEEETGAKFLDVNFGAGSGYQDSIKASKQLGLYRQKYCGCEYSRKPS
ncbi:MAG: epoxyqueuosine reductase QueH [Candidatus Falkowbacteria bacterium]